MLSTHQFETRLTGVTSFKLVLLCTMTRIDLSHTITHGMVTYRGLPAPLICDYLSREASRKIYAEGTEFQIGRIDMVANTGTYLDSPFHRYADGKDLSGLGLESLAGLASLVRAAGIVACSRFARSRNR